MWLTPATTNPWLARSSATADSSSGGKPLGESSTTGYVARAPATGPPSVLPADAVLDGVAAIWARFDDPRPWRVPDDIWTRSYDGAGRSAL